MTVGYEPVLHALSVEPAIAHPGEPVRIGFRTQNVGSGPTPAGTVRFLLPSGLEPLDREASAERAVPAVAPGEHVATELLCHVVAPVDDGTPLRVQAVLHTGDETYATNRCSVTVCSRPVLDGSKSGVFVERIADDRVRLRAVITNEGDGAAQQVRIVVAPPAGTAADDAAYWSEDRAAFVAEAARIDAQETNVHEFEVRIVAPVATIRADDAQVELGDGSRYELPARSEIVLHAALAEPIATVTVGRRQIELAVLVRNDGWADACDSRVQVSLPPLLRLRDESVAVNGIPVRVRRRARNGAGTAYARLERTGAEAQIAIARIPARSAVRLDLRAVLGAAAAGPVGVALHSGGSTVHAISVPFDVTPARDVRMRLASAAAAVEPGSTASALLAMENLGDVVESLALTVEGPGDACASVCNFTLEPGEVALRTVMIPVPQQAVPPATAPARITLSGDAGECARIECALPVRRGRAALPDLHVRCSPPADREPARIAGVLRGPERVVAGAPFAIEATIALERTVGEMVLRIAGEHGLVHVAGSTSLDGSAVLERGRAPLEGDGLTLRDVPERTELRVCCSLIAPPSAILQHAIALHVVADGTVHVLGPVHVDVEPAGAFLLRAAAFPYHLDAQIARVPTPSPPPALARVELPARPERSAQELHHRTAAPTAMPAFGDDRRARVLRTIGGAGANVLVSHLLAAHALFPPADATGCELSRLSLALDDVFERLFVKLRIPGFVVACTDLDDPEMRDALLACVPATDAERLANAPFGAPAVLRALVRLLPTRCDESPTLAVALERYVTALDEAMARFESVPLSSFEDALADDAGAALRAARAGVLHELRGGAALAGVA